MVGNSIARFVPPGYVMVGELARMSGVTVKTIHNWTNKGWLKHKNLVISPELTVRIFDEQAQRRAIRLGMTARGRDQLLRRHLRLRTNTDGSKRKVRALPPDITKEKAQEKL